MEGIVMDYRELLKKYISLVLYNEGTDAIDSFYEKHLIQKLDISLEDWRELCLLSDEVDEDLYDRRK